jgi:DNA transposition AAA+ family ATPase
MTQSTTDFNGFSTTSSNSDLSNGNGFNTVAPLTNIGLCAGALRRASSRADHLPGMVVFYGPSGWGKSTAAAYAANKQRAYYIECKSTWTKKATLAAILQEIGIPAPKTIYEMTDAISEQLAKSGRPLIIDEMDHLADKAAVEIVRDLYEGSGAAILLIGEERLPKKLEKWERFHGRILDFVPAQPSTLEDARHLSRMYCKGVTIADDLLEKIHKLSNGSARRICVNLERVFQEAAGSGMDSIDLAQWGKRELFTGFAPARRV